MASTLKSILKVFYAAIVAELAVYLMWAIIVVVVGLALENPAKTQAFSATVGPWAGVAFGFLFCTVVGWWIARRSAHPLLAGTAVGFLCAMIDLIVIAIVIRRFPLIPILGLPGRVLGGLIGAQLSRSMGGVAKMSHSAVEDA